MKKETFNDLFLVHSREFTKEPEHPWVYLKKRNRWVNSDEKIYNKEDRESLKKVLKENKVVNEIKPIHFMCFPI